LTPPPVAGSCGLVLLMVPLAVSVLGLLAPDPRVVAAEQTG
jgi:hypothetical protein